MKTFWIVSFLAALTACSTPDALSRETADGLNKVGTGVARGESQATETGTAAAASYMGSARSEHIRASAQRQVTSTTSGHVQQGFTLGGAQDALRIAQGDPLVQSLVAELEALQGQESPDTGRIDAVRERLASAIASAREAAIRLGGDLSALQSLTVVNVMRQATGADEPQVTAEDAEAAKQIPEVIRAARNPR